MKGLGMFLTILTLGAAAFAGVKTSETGRKPSSAEFHCWDISPEPTSHTAIASEVYNDLQHGNCDTDKPFSIVAGSPAGHVGSMICCTTRR
jgi:hypothetical protein